MTGLTMHRFWLADIPALDALAGAIDVPHWAGDAVSTSIIVGDSAILPTIRELARTNDVEIVECPSMRDIPACLLESVRQKSADYVQVAANAVIDFGPAIELFGETLEREQPDIAIGRMAVIGRSSVDVDADGAIKAENTWMTPGYLTRLSDEQRECAGTSEFLDNLVGMITRDAQAAVRSPLVIGGYFVSEPPYLSEASDDAARAQIAMLDRERDRLVFERNDMKVRMREKNEALRAQVFRTRDALTAAREKVSELKNSRKKNRQSARPDLIRLIAAAAPLMQADRGAGEGAYWPQPPHGALAAAIVATQCGFWARAIDLWRDQFYRGRCPQLAAWCGAEAGFRAGCYGFADQMLAQLDSPDPAIIENSGKTREIREARKDWFGGGHATDAPSEASISEMLSLHLFREALRDLENIRIADTVEMSMRLSAYQGLGMYDRITQLRKTNAPNSADDEWSSAIAHAEAKLSRFGESLEGHIARFAAEHPASHYLRDIAPAMGPVS